LSENRREVTDHDVPKTIAELANRLKQLTHEREQAERTLAKSDRAHEAPEVIQQRIEQREKQEEAARKEQARQP